MELYDRSRESYQSPCAFATTFAHIAQESIFNRITAETTQQQFQAAQESLLALCQEFEAQMGKFHYPAITGTHRCVRAVYQDCTSQLANLAIMQPKAQPPAPRQPLTTPAEVVAEFDELFLLSSDERPIGKVAQPPDERQSP